MKAYVLIRLQEFEKAVTALKELTTDEINLDLPACLPWFLPISDWKISKELSKRTGSNRCKPEKFPRQKWACRALLQAWEQQRRFKRARSLDCRSP